MASLDHNVLINTRTLLKSFRTLDHNSLQMKKRPANKMIYGLHWMSVFLIHEVIRHGIKMKLDYSRGRMPIRFWLYFYICFIASVTHSVWNIINKTYIMFHSAAFMHVTYCCYLLDAPHNKSIHTIKHDIFTFDIHIVICGHIFGQHFCKK